MLYICTCCKILVIYSINKKNFKPISLFIALGGRGEMKVKMKSVKNKSVYIFSCIELSLFGSLTIKIKIQ